MERLPASLQPRPENSKLEIVFHDQEISTIFISELNLRYAHPLPFHLVIEPPLDTGGIVHEEVELHRSEKADYGQNVRILQEQRNCWEEST